MYCFKHSLRKMTLAQHGGESTYYLRTVLIGK